VIRRGLDVLEAREGGFVVLEQSIATAPAGEITEPRLQE